MKRTPLRRHKPLRAGRPKRWKPTAKGRAFWRRRRREVLERDGGRCVKCGDVATVADHIVRLGARVPGGRYNQDAPENATEQLQALCWSCSDAKDSGMVPARR